MWYIDEYAARQTPEILAAELRRHKARFDPAFRDLMSIFCQFHRLKQDYRIRTDAWLWESQRAEALEAKMRSQHLSVTKV